MRAVLATRCGDDAVEVVDDLSTLDPGPGEVAVAVRAAGICHSDLSALNGTIPQRFPFVLGHEGAGEVVAVGEGVSSVVEGDHVIIAWNPPCGRCRACQRGQPNLCVELFFEMQRSGRFRRGDEEIFGTFGTGTWAERLVVPEQAAVPIAPDVPFDVAALVGCGVTTGVGAAVNTAKVEVGSSVVVFGCGGVGVAALQGARLCGAAAIVAVDPVGSKLADARRFGATHAVEPDGLADVRTEVTGGEGFDYAFECVGTAATFRAAWDATRRGGTAVIVGAGRGDAVLSLNGLEIFFSEKKLLGSYYGSADVRTEFHRLLALWRAGRLDLEGMISARLDLAEAPEGLQAIANGSVVRQVLTP